MAEWKKILLEGDANNATGGDGIEVSAGGVVSADLKANAGLVIDSAEIALDLGASAITGTLAVGNGGTGIAAAPKGSVLVANAANTISALDGGGAGQDGYLLTYDGTADTISWAASTGEANQNAFSNVTVDAGTSQTAESATDTLTLTGETNVITTTGSSDDIITFSIDAGGIGTDKIANSAVTFAKMAGAAVINATETIATNDNDSAFPTSAAVIDYVESLTGSNITGFLVDNADDSTSGTLTAAGFVAPSLGVADASGTDQAGGLLTIQAGAGTGAGAGGSIKFNVAASGTAGTSVNGFSTAMSIDETGLVTINGGLDVNGTLTTIDTTNLRVEDHLIQLNNTTTPSTTNGNDGGIEVMTGDTTQDPHVFWSNNAHLTGWSLRKRGTASTAGRIMVQTTAAGDPTAEPVAGVGSMYYASTSKSMFVYVDS